MYSIKSETPIQVNPDRYSAPSAVPVAVLGLRNTLSGFWSASEGHSDVTSILALLGTVVSVYSPDRKLTREGEAQPWVIKCDRELCLTPIGPSNQGRGSGTLKSYSNLSLFSLTWN